MAKSTVKAKVGAPDKAKDNSGIVQDYQMLLDASNDPKQYDTVATSIIAKYGSDVNFLQAVSKTTGQPIDQLIQQLQQATSGDSSMLNETQGPGNPPLTQQPTPTTTLAENALHRAATSVVSAAGRPPAFAEPQPATDPMKEVKAAQGLANQGMSPGQATNVANQQSQPKGIPGGLAKGGVVDHTKGCQCKLCKGGLKAKSGGLIKKLEYGGTDTMGGMGQDKIGLEAGGDIDTIDITGDHKAGMLGGGLMNMPNYNNSVEMAEGGDVPPGSLSEETADDQPTMLSKGELVKPAFDTRYHGLETHMLMRDEATLGNKHRQSTGDLDMLQEDGSFLVPAPVVRAIGTKSLFDIVDYGKLVLDKMDEAGQIRSPGDGKNPGEPGEAKTDLVLTGPTKGLFQKGAEQIEEDLEDATGTQESPEEEAAEHGLANGGLPARQGSGDPNMAQGGAFRKIWEDANRAKDEDPVPYSDRIDKKPPRQDDKAEFNAMPWTDKVVTPEERDTGTFDEDIDEMANGGAMDAPNIGPEWRARSGKGLIGKPKGKSIPPNNTTGIDPFPTGRRQAGGPVTRNSMAAGGDLSGQAMNVSRMIGNSPGRRTLNSIRGIMRPEAVAKVVSMDAGGTNTDPDLMAQNTTMARTIQAASRKMAPGGLFKGVFDGPPKHPPQKMEGGGDTLKNTKLKLSPMLKKPNQK